MAMAKRRGKCRAMKVVGRSKPMTYKGLDRRILIDKLGLNCHWCGISTDNSIYNDDSPRKTTIDHVYNKLDPRRKGNNDKVVIACEACNLMRARMHEFIFGMRNFPIEYQLNLPLPEPKVAELVVEKAVEVQPKTIARPVFQGPRVVKDVPPLTRWQKLVAFVSLKVWKIKKAIKTYVKHKKYRKLFKRKGASNEKET